MQPWCETFGESLHHRGVFVFPAWLFCKNHWGAWGFSIGDANVDDVPSNVRMTCLHSSNLIYPLFSQSHVFPPNGHLHDLVAQCHSDGYKALKLLSSSHICWITVYPVGCRDPYVVIKIHTPEEVSSCWSLLSTLLCGYRGVGARRSLA